VNNKFGELVEYISDKIILVCIKIQCHGQFNQINTNMNSKYRALVMPNYKLITCPGHHHMLFVHVDIWPYFNERPHVSS
jgi:hypothetical protein